MVSCSQIIQMMHDVIDTLTITHDVPTMNNLFWSIYKLFNMYVSQCYYPTVSA